jgi:hypothetical protein
MLNGRFLRRRNLCTEGDGGAGHGDTERQYVIQLQVFLLTFLRVSRCTAELTAVFAMEHFLEKFMPFSISKSILASDCIRRNGVLYAQAYVPPVQVSAADVRPEGEDVYMQESGVGL